MGNAKISPQPNGPLKVEGGVPLFDAEGAEVEARETYFLCRCGRSGNKPFCDGSHKKVDYAPEVDEDRRLGTLAYRAEIEGLPVEVRYSPLLCSHAAVCVATSSAVFDPDRKPWIKPGEGDLSTLRKAVGGCPSGALRLSTGDAAEAGHITAPPEVEAITVTRDGPYKVSHVALDAAFEAEGASTEKYVLCRCGRSGNAPFCDGSHRDAKWSDEERA